MLKSISYHVISPDAQKHFLNNPSWTPMLDQLTHSKIYSDVISVIKNSLTKVTSKAIQEYTQERIHTLASTANKGFHLLEIKS